MASAGANIRRNETKKFRRSRHQIIRARTTSHVRDRFRKSRAVRTAGSVLVCACLTVCVPQMEATAARFVELVAQQLIPQLSLSNGGVLLPRAAFDRVVRSVLTQRFSALAAPNAPAAAQTSALGKHVLANFDHYAHALWQRYAPLPPFFFSSPENRFACCQLFAARLIRNREKI
jgi:hypothetical protein